jgi:glucose/arabinose dehydrogenase
MLCFSNVNKCEFSVLKLCSWFSFRGFVVIVHHVLIIHLCGHSFQCPSLDWTHSNNFDRGFTGLAIHPDFPQQPYVFALFGRDGKIGGSTPLWNDKCDVGLCEASNALARFTWDIGEKRLKDYTEIVVDWCIITPTHQVGDIVFDRNGNLIISAGDMTLFDNIGMNFGEPPNTCPQANPNDTESGGSLQSITVGNPVGKVTFITKKDLDVWMKDHSKKPNLRPHALGFRNPYRMAMDSKTNQIFLGDVGFANWEELNLLDPIEQDKTVAPKNYGWPCYEGPTRVVDVQNRNFQKCEALYRSKTAMTKALFHYDHKTSFGDTVSEVKIGGQSAITGVDVYRGKRLPSEYNGSVWFVDCT